MNKEISQTIQQMTERIVISHRPKQIILFGSQAEGNAGENSDIDLFVVTESTNTRETAREIDRTLWDRIIPVDIIVSTPSQIERRISLGDSFIQKIINQGKILYAQ